MVSLISEYTQKFNRAFTSSTMHRIQTLAEALEDAWVNGNTVYLCGNGGSASNAVHIANDLLYGVGVHKGVGLKVEALSVNHAVITCLANDTGYENIYSEQLKVKASHGDILIVLSGSGNSLNIVKALEVGNLKGMKTFAILGFSGGKCKELAQFLIHFELDDMEVVENLQLAAGHICKQWLLKRSKTEIFS